MVELPDDVSEDSKNKNGSNEEGESLSELVAALRSQVEGQQELVDSLQAQVKAQQEELAAKNKQIEQLHILLQQAQAALPAPKENRHSRWYKFWHRTVRWDIHHLKKNNVLEGITWPEKRQWGEEPE
jgi:multidrug efflux pump subunit AcrA (membrane-fusion protein)